jgi:DNA-binding beta-propeller fold protein YncE
MCGVETPRGIALDATRQLLFVIAGNNGRLDRISLDDGSCSSFPDDVGYGADSVVVDSARDRVYVINLLESTVDTIDTEGNHRGTYNITGAGQGIAVDARTGYVFAEEETLGKLLVLAPD